MVTIPKYEKKALFKNSMRLNGNSSHIFFSKKVVSDVTAGSYTLQDDIRPLLECAFAT